MRVATKTITMVSTVISRQLDNPWGFAGFVVSLTGLLLGNGLLCAIGIFLSLVGVYREPKGFAIAGIIIGLIGLVLILLFFFCYLLPLVNRLFDLMV